MEYERAIFRVYERCIESLRDETDDTHIKYCRLFEIINLSVGVFFLFALCQLHFTFVSPKTSICLEDLLLERNISSIGLDQLIYIDVDNRFSPDDNGSYLRGRATDDYTASGIIRQGFDNINASLLNTTDSFTLVRNAYNDAFNHSFDYQFALDVAVLVLPNEIKRQHNFNVVNITMSGSKCFGNFLTQQLISFGGVDTIILNELVKVTNKGGALTTKYEDFYSWDKSQILLYSSTTSWIYFKVSVFLESCISFFLLSTSTAILIRVLISSGVVFMFPAFYFMQSLGVNIRLNHVIRVSYPWIGVPMEFLALRNQPVVPFLFGHVIRVIVSYVYYEACQVAFSFWLYNQISPGQIELWLFAIMMLWEYYSMIYVRSLGSIQLFPRASLALFLIYHFYYYSFPFGFHSLALLVMFLFLSALMIHCVRKYEIDAFYRGHVSIDQPRMLYNTVPWPSWNGSLAPDMTLFIPVFHRARSIYQDNVPDPAIGGTPFVASEQGPASVVGRPTDPAVQQYDSFQHSSTLATSSASVGAAAAADSSALEMSFVDSRVDVVGEEQPLATNSSLSRNTISRYLVSGNVSSRPHYSRLQSSEPQSLNNLPDVEND